jgi:putative membrane protein
VIRTMVLAGVASFCLVAPTLAQTGAALPTTDFIKAVATTDEFERVEGRMAERDGASDRVRDFGKMMVRDHTNTTMALKQAIHSAGLPIPGTPHLTPEQAANVAALKALHGAAFDHAYMEQQIQAHQTALGVMQAYAAGGENPTLRNAAASTVPIVQHHLAMARKIAG